MCGRVDGRVGRRVREGSLCVANLSTRSHRRHEYRSNGGGARAATMVLCTCGGAFVHFVFLLCRLVPTSESRSQSDPLFSETRFCHCFSPLPGASGTRDNLGRIAADNGYVPSRTVRKDLQKEGDSLDGRAPVGLTCDVHCGADGEGCIARTRAGFDGVQGCRRAKGSAAGQSEGEYNTGQYNGTMHVRTGNTESGH